MPVEKASVADVPALNKLVNSAYRGEASKQGWTTESHLLEGLRIDEETLHQYFNTPGTAILKYTGDDDKIKGCVYLEERPGKLYLGMFSVLPTSQGKGIGRKLLEGAEDYARQTGYHTLCMTVISVRFELIAWYKRRGYIATGEIRPFHHDKKFGIPLQPIELAVLEKVI